MIGDQSFASKHIITDNLENSDIYILKLSTLMKQILKTKFYIKMQ